MKKFFPYVIIASILLLLVVTYYVYSNERDPSVDQQPLVIDNQEPDAKVNSFSTVLDHIFIGQKGEFSSSEIVSFVSDFPKKEQRYSLHDQDLYLFVQFIDGLSEEQEQQYLSQIKIEGEQSIQVQISKNITQHQIDITNINQEVSITFGDLPPITIERTEPLEISLKNSNPNDNRLFLKDKDKTPVLLVPEDGTNPILSFSETMDTSKMIYDTNNKEVGKWLNDTSYEVNLENISNDAAINLEKLYSLNGNYLPNGHKYVYVKKSKGRIWKDLTNQETQIGWGERLRYYDKILFSPNKERYIGIVDIGMIEGDALGTNYAYILEEKNKKSTMVEEYFYSDFNMLGYPLQWISDEAFIYGDRHTVYMYHVLTGEKEILIDVDLEESGSIHQIAYNPYQEEIYLYLLKYYYEQEGNKEVMYVNKWTYKKSETTPLTENKFSEMFSQEGFFKSLPIHISQDGVYWTIIEGTEIVTVFEGNDQKKKKYDGEIILLNEKGIVFKAKNHSLTEPEFRYYWVNKTGDEVKIPPVQSYVGPFGGDLVSIDYTENKISKYNFDEKTWTFIEKIDKIQLPIQEINSYYFYN